MSYLHGVYTSIAPTAVSPSVNAASAVPFVVGIFPDVDNLKTRTPIRVRSYSDYLEKIGSCGELKDWDIPPMLDDDNYSKFYCSNLDEFADVWFNYSGGGDAFFVVESVNFPNTVPEDGPGTRDGFYIYLTKKVVVDSNTKTIEIDGYVHAKELKNTAQIGAVDFTESYQSGKTIIKLTAPPDGNYTYEIHAWVFDINHTASEDPDIKTYHKLIINYCLDKINNVYAIYNIIPTMMLCPGMALNPDILAKMISLSDSFGDDFKCMVLANLNDRTDLTPDSDTGAVDLTVSSISSITFQRSPRLIMCYPYAKIGGKIAEMSNILSGVLANTDSKNAALPYVSPSNKIAPISGLINDDIGGEGAVWHDLWLTQSEANDFLEAYGIVTARNTAKGWVIWGNNTAAYPGSTDPVERFICVQRMFQWVLNDFTLYAQPRIDLPLNKRNIEALAHDYEARLGGFIGTAITSARVVISLDQNDVLQGIIRAHIYIGVPVPMAAIIGTAEFEVEAYLNSLA